MPNSDHLPEQAKKVRNLVLDMIFEAKSSHLGCSLSCVDILTAFYSGGIMHIRPKDPAWAERDRFILSKGHACVALYAALAVEGFFPLKKLKEFGTEGTLICDHNSLGSLPGIETSNGSLGHGLSLGIGMAWHLKNKSKSRVFVLVGDGECQEGSIWEGLMFAGFHNLTNIVLIIDNNGFETVGSVDNILSLEPLNQKIESFGWQVKTIDGHDFTQIASACTQTAQKPLAIIAKTIKGKGVAFMEHDWVWHGKRMSTEDYQRAKTELNGGDK